MSLIRFLSLTRRGAPPLKKEEKCRREMWQAASADPAQAPGRARGARRFIDCGKEGSWWLGRGCEARGRDRAKALCVDTRACPTERRRAAGINLIAKDPALRVQPGSPLDRARTRELRSCRERLFYDVLFDAALNRLPDHGRRAPAARPLGHRATSLGVGSMSAVAAPILRGLETERGRRC